MANDSSDNGVIRLGAVEQMVGYHLKRASAVVAADFARVMAGTGVRQVLFGLLSVIEANPGINQKSVGRVLGIQAANMVTLVNELITSGLVDRTVLPEDRRAMSLTLTPAGQATFARCRAALQEHEQRLLSDFSPSERETLIALAARIEAQEI